MSDLATNASLIVAALDLQVVQLLRAAIRTADLQSLADRQSSPAASTAAQSAGHSHRRGGDCYCESQRSECCNPAYCCSPVYSSRRVLHPTPRVDLHCAPRLALDRHEKVAEPVTAATPSPIQAPWKTLAWKDTPRVTMKVKMVQRRTDIINKGSLIDYFI
ncbi:MAG TPA: hypothetical protein VG269_12715 [Tepidisphaeraceae bacterium]|nr:hypothetical protein [Tepidisphaeraceae bacterium]